jgi:hypothetical protein
VDEDWTNDVGRPTVALPGEIHADEDVAEFQLVRRGDPVPIERVQPRRGALAATIKVKAAET